MKKEIVLYLCFIFFAGVYNSLRDKVDTIFFWCMANLFFFSPALSTYPHFFKQIVYISFVK
jgi:hypothetical protein